MLDPEGRPFPAESLPGRRALRGEPAPEALVRFRRQATGEEALYRIAQEALHNVVKHAGAHQIELTLESEPAELVLEVRDDGAGFDAITDFPGHLGLRSMRERASRLGGALSITSAPGTGTRLTARIPRRDRAMPPRAG